MTVRTDLAIEFAADKVSDDSGIRVEKYVDDSIEVSTVEVLNSAAAQKLGKPIGKYVTLEAKSSINLFEHENLRELIVRELVGMLGNVIDNVLVIGIGNTTVTPDALGPKAASGVLATRHISNALATDIGLKGLKSVSVLWPGVLGQTGIEVKEVVDGAVKKVKPEAVILIDALTAREISRLGNTVQISNTGISPGSGVGNSRSEISVNTIGVRCITVGVPTVVEASTLCYDLTGHSGREHEPLIVTPKDIDRLVQRSSKIISQALNIALQPEIDLEVLLSVV